MPRAGIQLADMPGRSQHGRAFTLVELLVVIAIIGLLVSILYPALHTAMALVRRARCQTNLHAVAVGMRMYLNESNEVMPVAAQMPSLRLTDDPPIAEVLGPLLSSPETLLCPADPDEKYFKSEGSSYEYQSILGGRKVADSFLTKRFGEHMTPVMNDYEPFHGQGGEPGAANYLFANGRVGDLR